MDQILESIANGTYQYSQDDQTLWDNMRFICSSFCH